MCSARKRTRIGLVPFTPNDMTNRVSLFDLGKQQSVDDLWGGGIREEHGGPDGPVVPCGQQPSTVRIPVPPACGLSCTEMCVRCVGWRVQQLKSRGFLLHEVAT